MSDEWQGGGLPSGRRGPQEEVPGSPAHLSRIANRTTLMSIDALLASLPKQDHGYVDAAMEARILARRLQATSDDLRAAMPGCLSRA
ncbi:hypothetical protein HHL28_10130 [Aerophototrophica crusticola]|uniref:Uncharacterized protein n=1 Tax=Aerophototrophica crusticola TaxID=1709002 RepID=A0A858R888_9PROT|nr:hypothetical protein HHL28_10130 [Rhodospirillaceae bacterium B3]